MNPFDRTVEMFPEADSLLLTGYHPDEGLVSGQAYDSRTGCTWSLVFIGGIDDALQCRYPLSVPLEEEGLIAYLDEHQHERPHTGPAVTTGDPR